MFLRLIGYILLAIGTLFLLIVTLVIAIVVSDYYAIPDRFKQWWTEFGCYLRDTLATQEFKIAAPLVAALILTIVGLIVIGIARSMLRK